MISQSSGGSSSLRGVWLTALVNSVGAVVNLVMVSIDIMGISWHEIQPFKPNDETDNCSTTGDREIERLISNPSEIQIINNSNKLRPSFINIHQKLPNQVTSSVKSRDVPRPWFISQRRHH